MKGKWFIYVAVSCLAAVLVVLGILQYRGLDQISESEAAKMHKRVSEEADLFASDFNREMQNAYFNFQTDEDTFKTRNWADFNARYDYWRQKTNYPDLISGFLFIPAIGDEPLLRYDLSGHAFNDTAWTPELRSLRTTLTQTSGQTLVMDDPSRLVLPIHDSKVALRRMVIRRARPNEAPAVELPDQYGFLMIELNDSTIGDHILPDLAQKYFSDGDFRLLVSNSSNAPVYSSQGSVDGADSKVRLFDLSADNFIFYANRQLMTPTPDEKDKVVIDSHIENRTFSRDGAGANSNVGALKIEVQRSDRPMTSVFTATNAGDPSAWTLAVQHKDGSIEAYAAKMKARNLGFGFGLLFLLAAAITAIVVSAQRSKILAQRQIDFVSSVSHEFRTPLAVIYSAGENLADGITRERDQITRYGDLIKGEGKKLSAMVEQILEFAGARSGRRKFSLSSISVGDVVDDALNECRPMIRENGVDLETDIDRWLPQIDADRNAMSQAIQNLVVNAIKYGSSQRNVRVSAHNGGKSVSISVTDRGIGISKADLGKVFEPFYRATEVVDSQIRGNGLGLSLVKEIVTAHGGRVLAESKPGVGSTFTIELPAGSTV